jgi:hypothetical protein
VQIDGAVSGAKQISAIDSRPSDSGVSTQHQRKKTYVTPAFYGSESHFSAAESCARLATCNMQHATCKLHLANLQRATCKNATFKMQQTWLQPCTSHATSAMQHTTRCMATPALVLVAFCRRNVDVLAWECRIIRFHCLTLAAFLCYWRAQGKRTSKKPITRTKITTQTTGLYLGSREGTSTSFRCNCGELASSCCRWRLIFVTS